jgi:hypothetical protein
METIMWIELYNGIEPITKLSNFNIYILIYVLIYIHETSYNNIGICEVCLKMGEIPLFGGWINPDVTKFTGIVHGFPTWFSNLNDS